VKRHQDAIAIQAGACNPSSIAHSIVEACKEIRDTPAVRYSGKQITDDPAVRLMVHQLAYICNVARLDDLTEYGQAVNECRLRSQEVQS
jgi:hypothetical protein